MPEGGHKGRPYNAIFSHLLLRDENVSDDAEAQLASQVGERGDEFEGKAHNL